MVGRHPWAGLKELRICAGHTQTSLSGKARVSQVCIAQLEQGVRLGRPATLRRIADALEVTVLELLATRPDVYRDAA